MSQFTFFYGGPFSQWYKAPIIIDGVYYSTAEQYMMAKKALLFNDTETHKKIMDAKHPKDQKQYGREVKGFKPDVWNAVCKQYVYEANYAKFTQNEDLYNELMASKGTELVETSPDLIWGCGLYEDNPLINDKSNWTGTNWLGEIITQVREDLIAKNKYWYR